MFLLILAGTLKTGQSNPDFTFHNVSINTKVKDLKVNLFMVFTFHNVSINTSALSILFSACSIKILDFTDFAEQLISYIYLQNRVFWI